MSTDPISSASSSKWAGVQKIRQDFQSLKSDLQSGNLSGAQTDFATLLDDAPGLKARLQNTPSTPAAPTDSSSTSPLSALSTALQSGDIQGAETAFTSMRQSLGGAHHHHHHHRVQSADSSNTNASDGTAINSDLQSLVGALQSGNLSAAQQAMAQLTADDPQLANSITAATPTV